MKNRYKSFMTVYRADVKKHLYAIKKLNENFVFSDVDILQYEYHNKKLREYTSIFNEIFNTNIFVTRFINFFILEG